MKPKSRVLPHPRRATAVASRKKRKKASREKRKKAPRQAEVNWLPIASAAIGRRMAFQESFDVVRLAVELARLRGKCEPAAYLDEAAMLLTKALVALANEREQPQREQEAIGNAALEHIKQNLCPSRIPFEKLCRPAEETIGSSALPEYESFTVETELTAESKRQVEQLRKKRRVEVIELPDDDGHAYKFDWRVYRDEAEFRRLFEACWQTTADRKWREAKKGFLTSTGVFALYLARQGAYKARGAKVAASRQARGGRPGANGAATTK